MPHGKNPDVKLKQMINPQIKQKLATVLAEIKTASIAVSGGVDSVTLAAFASEILGSEATLYHALSPAVPAQATKRLTELASQKNWNLKIVNTGEFEDEDYMANPVNRCFFCKSNLYGSLAKLSDNLILSGTNTDDLSDWRPGLQAAKNNNVRHPFVEAGFGKEEIRALARDLLLPEIAELPSSPCLSSRIETGIAISPETLKLIDRIEDFVKTKTSARTVRCRHRQSGLVQIGRASCRERV